MVDRSPLKLVGVAVAALVVAPAFVVAASAQPAPQNVGVRSLYLRDCGTCHGSDGAGTNRGPSLVGVGTAWTDYELTTGRMPLANPNEKTIRRKPAYSPAVIRQLVDYVAAFGPGGVAIPNVQIHGADIARGGEVFRLQCAACHAWSGTGGALLHREAPSVVDATPVQIAEAVRVGPDTMPAFGTAAVSDADLNDLVAYVRTLGKSYNRGGDPLWHLGPLVEGGVAWVIGIGLVLLAIRWIGDPR